MAICGAKEKNAALVLENGAVFEGRYFGAQKYVAGEAVFNTGMVGYVESITDPSYHGQILCQTYPLAGNYGVCRDDFESGGPRIAGYVIHELCDSPSHWSSGLSLNEWLGSEGVPGIEGVDTRLLTQTLRSHGVMGGAIGPLEEREELLQKAKKIPDVNERDLVADVTVAEPIEHHASGETGRVILLDCGAKLGIVRSLLSRGLSVTRVPASYTADKILSMRPDGIVISNGPGDPKKLDYVIKTVRGLAEQGLPIMGICLGNQIIGLAFGADTYKLKFGHRGQNHPVSDGRRCYVTSQNHGYAVDEKSIKNTELDVLFTNVNDRSVEGVAHSRLRILGVQFHPEASPGPTDTSFLFDRFAKDACKS